MDDDYKKLEGYKNLVEESEEYLKEVEEISVKDENYRGSFWGVFETRPYMRTLHSHYLQLVEVGYYHQAIFDGFYMLVINESDNSGIRYTILPLLKATGMFEVIEDLREKYNEESFSWDFPYVVSLFEQNKHDEAKALMEEILVRYPYAYSIIVEGEEPSMEDYQDLQRLKVWVGFLVWNF